MAYRRTYHATITTDNGPIEVEVSGKVEGADPEVGINHQQFDIEVVTLDGNPIELSVSQEREVQTYMDNLVNDQAYDEADAYDYEGDR